MSKRARQQGELESLILDTLWNANAPMTSQQILEMADPSGDMAITTVLTVLSRLAEKGMVIRENGEGRTLLFSATESREEHAAKLMLSMVAESGNPALALSHFTSGLTPEQIKQLRSSLEG